MWVKTQEGDLVNLDQMEWIVVEPYDEDDEGDYEEETIDEDASQAYELRAYQAGWDSDDMGSAPFYTLASSPDEAVLGQHLRAILQALTAGTGTFEIPAPETWTSG